MDELLKIIFLLLSIPAFSMFIKKTYESGMIFRRLYLFFIYHWIKNWRKKDRYKRFFIKPFICVYCSNVWFTIIAILIYKIDYVIYLPLIIGITYIILEIYFILIDLYKRIK